MFHYFRSLFLGLVPIFALPAYGDDALGPLDYRDVAGYMVHLQHSQTPEAKLLRWDIVNGHDRVAYERRATERAGIPLDLRRLQASLPPDDQNAAPLYTVLQKELEDHPFASTVLAIQSKMEKGQPLTSVEEDVLQSFVTLRQPALQQIKVAVKKPRCVFRRDWTHLDRQIFFENHAMISEAFLLRAESHVLFRRGQTQDAINELALLVPLAEQAASDPTLLCLNIGQEIDHTGVAGLAEILQQVGLDSLVNGWIQQTAVKVPHYDLGRIFSGEAAIAAANFRAARLMPPSFFASLQNGAGLPNRDIPEAYTEHELRFVHRLLDNAEAIQLSEMRDLVLHTEWTGPARIDYFQRASEFQVLHEEPALSSLLGEPFVSAVGVPTTIALEQARHTVLATAAAVLAYTKDHKGVFPDRIEEAVPTSALDPFSDVPIAYRKEEKGFVVYSIGQNMKFDGGKPDMKPATGEAYFRFITPPSPSGK